MNAALGGTSGYKATTRAGKWEDVTDLFTDRLVNELKSGKKEFILNPGSPIENVIKLGSVLKFRKPLTDRIVNIKIMRMDTRLGRVWGKQVDLIDGQTAERIMQDQMNDMGGSNRAQRRWVAKRKR